MKRIINYSKGIPMSKDEQISPIEIGHFLSLLREQAGVKQAELAKKITWSPAMLSRIEVGDRPISADELETIVEGINTPEAFRLSEMLKRQWTILPRPPLSHPDQEILWNAEVTAQKLHELSYQPETKQAFQHRLEAYIEQIKKITGLILKREHQIAFIGSIGIGKSTAICQLSNLTTPVPNGNFDAVLEVGAGGITVCEVHLLTGADYEIRIEPRAESEIRADIRDFANYLLSSVEVAQLTDKSSTESDSQGISKEIERALRNMSKLTIRRDKQSEGKTIRTDKAKELARNFPNERDLTIEILSRMELHKRDKTCVMYQSSTGKPHLKWLKDTFAEINNGRHPDFTLPKRIEVVVPFPLISNGECTIRIIDTKGIDNKETATRPDLEGHLKDFHTITVLCSGFNDAPARNPWQLLERAKAIGIQTLELNSSLLVLPHTGQALAVKDETGQQVESVDEGYELKAEQIEVAFEPLGLRNLPVYFFNAFQDDVTKLREFLNKRISYVRNSFRNELSNTIDDSERLLANHEQEQIQEVIRKAGSLIASWIQEHETISQPHVHIYDDLINVMNDAHPSTIRATIWRRGEWINLDYRHYLSYGSRLFANSILKNEVTSFKEFCKPLIKSKEYEDAQDYFRQAEQILNTSYLDLLNRIEITGVTYFLNELTSQEADNFWRECENEIGLGYRNRVVGRNRSWFNHERRKSLEQELFKHIENEWKTALKKISALIDTD